MRRRIVIHLGKLEFVWIASGFPIYLTVLVLTTI